MIHGLVVMASSFVVDELAPGLNTGGFFTSLLFGLVHAGLHLFLHGGVSLFAGSHLLLGSFHFLGFAFTKRVHFLGCHVVHHLTLSAQ